MDTPKIKCPNCGNQFDVETALAGDIEKRIKEHLQEEYRLKLDAINSDKEKFEADKEAFAKKKLEENELFSKRLNVAVQKKEEELAEKLQLEMNEKLQKITTEATKIEQELKKFRAKEILLNEEKFRLEKLQENMEFEMKKQLQLSQVEIKKEAEERAMQRAQLQMDEERRKLQESEEDRASLLKRQLQDEAERTKKEAIEKERYEFDKQRLELQMQLEAQRKLAEEMKRKMEQGSMQMQGEIMEIALEELLRNSFRDDIVAEVPKGYNGADCILTVRNEMSQTCGNIVFESKRTKNFANDWIDKLKTDSRTINADIAVLVTEVLPKEMDKFGMIDGIWICTFSEVKSVVMLLRDSLLRIHQIVAAQDNKGDKMQMLYNYLTGNEFKSQIESIVESFTTMKEQLDKEKKVTLKQWAEREKQIDRVVESTISMYGSVKGIAGGAIQNIKALEYDDTEFLG